MAKLPRFSATRNGKIRGHTQAASDAANSADVRYVISRLRYNHLDPSGREMRIATRGTARLDRQSNPTGGGANLQVQLNDPEDHNLPRNSGTTIAQVIVPKEIFELANNCPEKNVHAHLESVVRSALIQSSNSYGFAFAIAAS